MFVRESSDVRKSSQMAIEINNEKKKKKVLVYFVGAFLSPYM